MTGYDTAGRIQDTYASAQAEFGMAPTFWIRYFTPSPAADLFDDDAFGESQGAWASGGPHVGCISAPAQSRSAAPRRKATPTRKLSPRPCSPPTTRSARSICRPTISSTAGLTRSIRRP